MNRSTTKGATLDSLGACQPWGGAIDEMGYGLASYRPKKRAHVAAYEAAYGAVPEGCVVHHLCENKACINLQHLEAVTRADHQRLHRPRLKLSDADVAEIRRRYPGETQAELAEAFGVGRSQIGRIVRQEARIFDHQRDCPNDVARPFPPVVGRGRGVVMDARVIARGVALRRLREHLGLAAEDA